MSVNSDDTVPSVHELARGDVTQLTTWMDSRDGRTNKTKLANVFGTAAVYGNINICEAIIDSRRVPDEAWAVALSVACGTADGMSVAQLVVRRCSVTTQDLHDALIECCTAGNATIMQWLLSEIQLSHDERVRWRLATASACGDINTVRLLAAQVKRDHINVLSHLLRTASFKGSANVVDWMMMHTPADVSLCGEIDTSFGAMTSLTAACDRGHGDIVRTLLQCVTPHTVNIQCGDRNDSALHFTIWYKEPAWYRSVNLHGACMQSKRELVDSLLYSADVDEQNVDGSTPLHNACYVDDKYIVQALLSKFASTDITDNDGRTPIDEAKFYNKTNLLSCFTPLLSPPDTTHTVYPANLKFWQLIGLNVTQSTAVDVVVSDVNISDERCPTASGNTQSTAVDAVISDGNMSDEGHSASRGNTQSTAVDMVISDGNMSDEGHSATRGNRHSHTQQHKLTRDINTAHNRRPKNVVHIV